MQNGLCYAQGMLRTDASSFEFLDKGNDFARYSAVLARVGVLDYGDSKEYVSPEELFHPDTVQSFDGIPLVVEHPDSAVGSANYKEHTVGVVINPKVEGNLLKGTLVVYDKDVMQKLDSKEIEQVSIARFCELEPKTGFVNDLKYDYVQRKIRGNHVALTKNGRAGSSVKVLSKLDSKGEFMKYRADDGKDYEIPEAVNQDLQNLKTKIKELEELLNKEKQNKANLEKEMKESKKAEEKEEIQKQIAELENQIKLIRAESEAWKKKYEELEKKIPEIVETKANEKAEVIEQAKALLGDSIDYAKLNVEQIKDELIARFLPYPEGLKIDSVTQDMRNVHYKAAL
ncbi:MAG: DUF2213 domain-containing protein [Leptospiraceae bacterium]|nr:DUF2213 domain-containing protein [Leptospiraceae bacterium]